MSDTATPTSTRPHISVTEAAAGILLATLHTNPLGEFETALADDLARLVTRAESDDAIRAVLIIGTHPGRFVSHANIAWLQQGGHASRAASERAASGLTRFADLIRQIPGAAKAARRTRLDGAVELDQLHETFLRMNTCGAIFVAALNGSALGVGAELAWACDLRVMAAGDYFLGQPEVLLGFTPGGGGTQRLPRLIGSHQGLLAVLRGGPLSADEALALGAIDDIVPAGELLDRVVTLADRYGSRSKPAVQAIKRLVYLGGSDSLTEGLRQERAAFVATLATPDAQARSLDYITRTEHDNELPLYEPALYRRALASGRFDPS